MNLPQDVTRRGEVHVESVHFGIVEGDRKLRRKSSKKLVHNSQIVSDIFVAEHLVILGGADGESNIFRKICKNSNFEVFECCKNASSAMFQVSVFCVRIHHYHFYATMEIRVFVISNEQL